MILILIVAAIVAAFAGELSDTIIILLVVVLNAAFGVFQETKAENAIDALQKMSTPTTRVRRDGQIAQLSSKELVVGDVILLEAGDIIPADVRFLKTQNVKVEEATLTGESVAVIKDEAVIDAESAALGDSAQHGLYEYQYDGWYGRGSRSRDWQGYRGWQDCSDAEQCRTDRHAAAAKHYPSQ